MKEEAFADVVRTTRVTEKLRLKDVAEALGVSIPYVSDIENGRRNPPDLVKLIGLADVLRIDRSRLVRLALAARRSIELPVDADTQKTEIAIALARTWDHMSPKQEEDIMRILNETPPAKE